MLINAKVDAFANCCSQYTSLLPRRTHTEIYLCNIPVQRQRIRNPKNEDDDDSPSVRQEPQERNVVQCWEHRYHDMGYGVTDDDTESNHAAKSAVTEPLSAICDECSDILTRPIVRSKAPRQSK